MSRPSTSRPVDHDVREARVDRRSAGSAGSAASSRRRDRRGDAAQIDAPPTSPPTSSWSTWAEADAPASRSERRRRAERPAADRPATTRRALRTDAPRTQAHHARSQRSDVHLDLDDDAATLSGPRIRHVKERKRHAAASEHGAAADSATTATGRAQVRAQRSDRRRSRRLRTVGALTLTVLGVTTAAMATNELRFSPFSDEAATVQQQVGAMAPIPDDERHRRPRQSVAVTVPTPEESTTKAKPRRTRTATATSESSTTGSGRPGVVLDGRMMGGWYNGASGIGVTNGEFAKWLGQPLTLAATWADTSDEVQRTLSPLQGEYGDWQGGLDIAVGGTILGSGENYAEAARGAYDDRWRAAAQVLAEKRKGKKGPTFVRPFHEMNCDWYENWTVTRDNSADYKAAFKRYVNILRQGLPELYVAFSPNYGTCNGLPISDWYPGDDVVDVIAPDYYNDYQDEANGSVSGWNDESDKKDGQGNPVGPEAWRQFAAAHGKPLAFPEVGLKPSSQGGGDRPEWIKALNSWMTKHQNTATWQIGQDIPKASAGKVLYFAYFNVEHDGDAGFTIFGGGANQNSAPVYQGLKWGNNRLG